MKGFKSALLLTNPDTEKVSGITLWETEADIPHVTDIVAETRGRSTRRFFEASPLERIAMIPLVGQATREIYQVMVQIEAGGEPMHASVLTAQVRRGKMDEAIRIAQDLVVPTVKQQKGFKSYIELIQGDTGKELVITLWEREADERNWESNGRYQGLAAKLSPLKVGPPTVERYEVSVQV